jgi:hypothetical protein
VRGVGGVDPGSNSAPHHSQCVPIGRSLDVSFIGCPLDASVLGRTSRIRPTGGCDASERVFRGNRARGHESPASRRAACSPAGTGSDRCRPVICGGDSTEKAPLSRGSLEWRGPGSDRRHHDSQATRRRGGMSRSRRHAGCILGGPLGRDILVHIAERTCGTRSHSRTRVPERLAAGPCPASASCGSDLARLP